MRTARMFVIFAQRSISELHFMLTLHPARPDMRYIFYPCIFSQLITPGLTSKLKKFCYVYENFRMDSIAVNRSFVRFGVP